MKKICPLIKDECMEHGCTFFTHLTGQHPQSGAMVDEWGCSITWLPILLIESTHRTMGVQASVESMRNEVVKRQDALNAAIDSATTGRLEANHEGRPAIDITPSSPRLSRDVGDVSSSESVER